MTRAPYVSIRTRVALRRRREARMLYLDRLGFALAHIVPAALIVWVLGKLFM